MARLKGGKLLKDFSQSELAPEFSYTFTDEEYKCVLEKGLRIKILNKGIKYVIDCNFIYNGSEFENNSTLWIHDSTYVLHINVLNKTLYLYT